MLLPPTHSTLFGTNGPLFLLQSIYEWRLVGRDLIRLIRLLITRTIFENICLSRKNQAVPLRRFLLHILAKTPSRPLEPGRWVGRISCKQIISLNGFSIRCLCLGAERQTVCNTSQLSTTVGRSEGLWLCYSAAYGTKWELALHRSDKPWHVALN
jgi:hypothetical protein